MHSCTMCYVLGTIYYVLCTMHSWDLRQQRSIEAGFGNCTLVIQLEEWRQENHKLEASVGCLVRLCLKTGLKNEAKWGRKMA